MNWTSITREKEYVFDIETGRLVYHFLAWGKLWADQFWREKARVCLGYVTFEMHNRNIIRIEWVKVQDRQFQNIIRIIPQIYFLLLLQFQQESTASPTHFNHSESQSDGGCF